MGKDRPGSCRFERRIILKITIAKWLTPKGNSISEVGLTPDVKVDITDQDIQAEKRPAT